MEALACLIEGGTTPLSALIDEPASSPRAALVLAHGAGAGMRHPFLAQIATALAGRGVAVVRYQFPYMEAGKRRVDPPDVAHGAVRAAAAFARERWPRVPLFAGGKSFGGRMTSQAQSSAPLVGVAGIVFFGFPLHPPERPGAERAAHLARVDVPMLFLQGTRDEFARPDLLRGVLDSLGARSTLVAIDDGDHAFAVRRKITGRGPADVIEQLADAVVAWIDAGRGRP